MFCGCFVQNGHSLELTRVLTLTLLPGKHDSIVADLFCLSSKLLASALWWQNSSP